MKFILLFFIPFLSRAQCDETFKRTLSLHYVYTPGASIGGGFEGGLIGDISPLSISVGGSVSVFDSVRLKEVNEQKFTESVNFRLYSKFAYRLYRANYRFTVNVSTLWGFDNEGSFAAPGVKLFMPAGYNFAVSIEPYYFIRDNSYLIQALLHYKF